MNETLTSIYSVGYAVGLSGGSRTEPFSGEAEMNVFCAGHSAGASVRRHNESQRRVERLLEAMSRSVM